MSKAARRQGTRRLPLSAGDTHASTDDDAPAPPDPAVLAASLLIGRAFGARRLDGLPAGRNGVVTVMVVPSVDWVDPVARAWREGVRPGQRYLNGLHGTDWYGGTWVCFEADEQDAGSGRNRSAETFANSIAKGLHCFGVTPDLDWLPRDMVAAADHTATLPLLSAADVRSLARRLCGGRPTKGITDEMAARLTPRLLRLARRPGQGPDDYLAKFAWLLDRDDAAKSGVRPHTSAADAVGDTLRRAPTLDRLHGMDEAVAWGRALARDLAAFRAGTLAWADVDCGCLLSGPPGCGKTVFARALAASCGVPLVTGSYGQWLGSGSGHQGSLLRSMRQTFADAKAKAPSILFIDEVDSFPNRGTVTHHFAEWEMQVVNALLAEIDGVDGREGVVLVAACNHPDKLDPALVRSGRLDRHIRIRLPDRAALAAILRQHIGPEAEGWNLARASLLAAGSTGADCERFARGARRRARLANRLLRPDDLEAELGGNSQADADTWLCAVHEAGHAAAAAILEPGSVAAVSLRGTAEHGGSTQGNFGSDYVTAERLFWRIVVVLAGRAAEEVIIGVPSSGAGGAASSDLAWATSLAAMSVGALGFDAELGLTWRGTPDAGSLRSMLMLPRIEASVSGLIQRAYERALALMRTRKAAVEVLAAELVNHRALDGAAVVRVLGQAAADEERDRVPDDGPGTHPVGDVAGSLRHV